MVRLHQCNVHNNSLYLAIAVLFNEQEQVIWFNINLTSDQLKYFSLCFVMSLSDVHVQCEFRK